MTARGHFQTIVPALVGLRSSTPAWRRERVVAPDGDFLDWDWLDTEPIQAGRPLWVLFHGLEGSSSSHYAKALATQSLSTHSGLVVVHFRGCSGEPNLAPRAYHSGDHAEVDWVLRVIRQRYPTRTVVAVGVSLGGNALLCWAGIQGQAASRIVDAVLAISAPLDLSQCGAALDQGLNRRIYTSMFLRTMKLKAQQKWNQYPGLFSLEMAMSAKTLYAFDDAFTAPIHGFGTVERYWRMASSLPLLQGIRIPACVLNACNDPFVPSHCLPSSELVAPSVQLIQPDEGGHVGFWSLRAASGHAAYSSRNGALPCFLFDWVDEVLGLP